MAKTSSYSLRPSMEENPAFLCLFSALDPNSDYQDSNSAFNFTTDSYFMERGPRYEAYSRLRDLKLRTRINGREEEMEMPMPKPDLSPSPLKKSVSFQKRKASRPPPSSSVVAQSVPDFSSALRKENRRPPPANRMTDKAATPPPSMLKTPKMYGNASKLGSRSVNSGEKKAGMAARKSYANIEELKGLSAAAAFSIAGENRGGRGGGQRVVGRNSVLGIRQSVQFY